MRLAWLKGSAAEASLTARFAHSKKERNQTRSERKIKMNKKNKTELRIVIILIGKLYLIYS